MKAIILAAGYATRLKPLTDTTAKPLLPIAGRPMIDYLCDKIAEVGEIDEIHVVTNRRFAGDFVSWAEKQSWRTPVRVHDDGTTSNEDRLGAIGDIQFTIGRANLDDDDLMVVAGDNLFDFSLVEYVQFWRGKGDGSAIALYRCPERELVKQYATVELDDAGKVKDFVEKPENPTTDLVAIATYLYPRAHVPLIKTYLDEGNKKDAPGNFVAWLYKREPVYGYPFSGDWLDIGNLSQLLEADNRVRARKGMPERAEYSMEG